MQIKRVQITRFDVPLIEPFVTALRPVPMLERILVEIETDTGIVGLGEGAPGPRVTGETQTSVVAVIGEMLAPRLLGEDPRRIKHLAALMDQTVAEAPTAKAAVELALQDLRAKAADIPLYLLLGGATADSTLEVPVVLSLEPPGEMADNAVAAVERGYRQCKIKLGEDPKTDIERVRRIANRVPDDISLKADANQGWRDAKTAASVIHEVGEHLDVVEQPVTEHNLDDLALLRQRFNVPVMPDESLWSSQDALELVKRDAGDIFNIKLMKTGGITDAQRVNAVAAANECRVQVGSMVEGHVGTAAGVHFALAHENVVWNEMVGPFMTTRGVTDLAVDEPRITVDGPGLGVHIDRDALDELAVDREVVT
jgi:L-alanine-DL-glutamate epimerase-like enolase superfamily enzyme